MKDCIYSILLLRIALSDFHLTRLTRIELDSCKIGLGGLELFIRVTYDIIIKEPYIS